MSDPAMPVPPSFEDQHDDRLGQAIEEYLAAARNEPSLRPENWAQRYPDITDELIECLAALDLFKRGGHSRAEAPRDDAGPADQPKGAPVCLSGPDIPHVPGYTIISELGSGGMGVVFKALQHKTKRMVALKFLHGDVYASLSARRRFEREIELAASLNHPGIVRILESGQADGRDYYAMELVEGSPLVSAQCSRSLSDIEKSLNLVIAICEAVNYAHQRGVIHRDLKPANIVVDQADSPHILDFGLARIADTSREDQTHKTGTGQLVGTLPYLSPEQASGAEHVDIRTDTYSLGVILYEMLAGRPPYDTQGDLIKALSNIAHALPPRPSQFRSQVKRDLDAIALKALEKAKDARYQTAAALAEDLRCYLRNEPVEANRTSRFYILRKAYARHRRGIQLASATLLFVLVASSIILSLFVKVRQQRNSLQHELHVNELRRGIAHLAAYQDCLAEKLLWGAYRQEPDRAAHWSLISYFTQNPLVALLLKTGWVTAMDYSPDGNWLACGNLDGDVCLRDSRNLTCVYQEHCHPGAVRALAFSPRSGSLISGGADGTLKFWAGPPWRQSASLKAHSAAVVDLCFSRNGDFISAGADGQVLRWTQVDKAPPTSTPLLHENSPIEVASCSPVGDIIAVASADGRFHMMGRDGRPVTTLPPMPKPPEAIRFSEDGRSIVLWEGGEVSVWNIASGTRLWADGAGLPEPRPTSLWDLPALDGAGLSQGPTTRPNSDSEPARPPHTCWRPTLRFSPDGQLLACTGWDASVRLWECGSGRLLDTLRSHETALYSAAFAPGTRQLAVGSVANIRIWDLNRAPGVASWPVHNARRITISISSESNYLVWSDGTDGTVRLVALRDGGAPQTWKVADSPVEAIALSSNGHLAVADRSRNIRLSRLSDRTVLREWSGTEGGNVAQPPSAVSPNEGSIHCIAISPDGAYVACGDDAGMLRLWRTVDGVLLHSWRAHRRDILAIACSPDGQCLLSGGTDWMVRLWRIGRDAPTAQWAHQEWVNAVAFAQDGRLLASGSAYLDIRIACPDGELVRTVNSAHAHWVKGLAFVEGGVLVSGGNDGAIRFWDCGTGEDLAMIPSIGGPVETLAATGDGRYLAVGAVRAIQLIDLGAAQETISKSR